MGMVNMTSEIKKILCDVTTTFEECAVILNGPKAGIGSTPSPKDSPECLMEDMAFIRDKALALRELSLMMKDILSGKEMLDASDTAYGSRY